MARHARGPQLIADPWATVHVRCLMLALLFPGQGAQSDGFLHRLPQHQLYADTLDEASQVLGIDVLTLDTPDALRSTVAVQIGLTVAGVAITRALADEQLTPEISAGFQWALTQRRSVAARFASTTR